VKELIKLELVDEVKTKEEMREERKPERGYVVESVGGTGYIAPGDTQVRHAPSSV